MTASTQKGARLLFVTEQSVDGPGLRAVPTQERSRRTLSAILDAASELLKEGGPDALTTSALADRTGLRVRNVYRYFRDRQAIVATLAERMNDRIESAVAGTTGLSDSDRPLERVLDDLIDRVITAAGQEPAAVQIRAAMRTNPELQQLDAASDHRIAGLLTDALRQRGIRTRRGRLEVGLFMLVTSIGAVLDRATLDDEGDGTALIRELKRLVGAYVATLT
jgi:AcrR family transcriptional regulator